MDKPRLHMVRKLWPGYTALYRSKAGDTVVIKSLDPPQKARTLRGQGGLRKYKLVKYKEHLQEVLIVAKSTKAATKGKRKAEVTDEEIEDLESVDDLEDLEDLEDEDEEDEEEEDDEDEDEDEDEDDEDDEEDDDEEEEEVVTKKKSKKTSKKPRVSRAAATGKVGTAEIAEAAGVDARTLRMVLRKHKVKKDEETGRYEWSSMKHKTVKQILAWLEKGEAEEIKKESLEKLKESQAKKRSKKKKASDDAEAKTSKKKTKKKKVVEEDEDDE